MPPAPPFFLRPSSHFPLLPFLPDFPGRRIHTSVANTKWRRILQQQQQQQQRATTVSILSSSHTASSSCLGRGRRDRIMDPSLSRRTFCTGATMRKTGQTSFSFPAGSRITLRPNPSRVDEPLNLRFTGLPPSAPVTLELETTLVPEQLTYRSRSFFLTSLDGTVNVATDRALAGGSYEGVSPMGAFWSMQPTSEKGKTAFFITADVTTPLKYKLKLWLGHKKDEDDKAHGQVNKEKTSRPVSPLLSECSFNRHYVSPGVRRMPVKAGRVRGTMFFPADSDQPAQGSHPLVVFVYGAGVHRGQIVEEKAALMAHYGFSTLALAYYGVDDLPKLYNEIDIGYFEEAFDYCAARDEVDKDRMGIFGVSKGGEIALASAAFLPDKIKAAVALNGCYATVGVPTFYKDTLLEHLTLKPVSESHKRDDGSVSLMGLLDDPINHPKTFIPFADCPADILMLASEDDQNFDSALFARQADQLAKKAGKANFEFCVLPGMGHVCLLPYSPPVFNVKHRLVPGQLVYMGGRDSLHQHMDGQLAVWRKTIEFFTRTLAKK